MLETGERRDILRARWTERAGTPLFESMSEAFSREKTCICMVLGCEGTGCVGRIESNEYAYNKPTFHSQPLD